MIFAKIENMKLKLVNYRILFYSFLALLFGIYVARGLYSGEVLTIVTVSLIFFGLTISLILSKHYKILISLVLIFLAGNGLFFLSQSGFSCPQYSQSVVVSGKVCDNIKESDYYSNVVLKNVLINGKKSKNISLSISNSSSSVKAGQVLSFECELENVKLFTLKRLNSFYVRQNIGYSSSVKYENLVITDGHKDVDEKVREAVKNSLYSKMSEENAGIAYGMLFGDKTEIDLVSRSLFQTTGIVHILTVSGLHISFLIAVFYSLLKKIGLNKYINFFLTSVLILFYLYLCSFSPSALRAGIMGILFMLSNVVGRKYDILNSLGFAGIIICLINPLYALDLGFLMSVFCVFGINLISPVFTKYLAKVVPFKIASLLAISFSAQIAVVPMLGIFGSTFNLFSFLVNLILVPFFAVLFPFLFVSSFLCNGLGFLNFLLVPASWGIEFVKMVVKFFSVTDFMFTLGELGLLASVFLYGFMFFISPYFMAEGIKKYSFISVAILCFSSSYFCFANIKDKQQSITVLTSYGDECLLLQDAGGENLLISYNNTFDKYARSKSINKVNYFLSLDDVSLKTYDSIKKYDFDYLFAVNGDKKIENLYLAQKNTADKVGNFQIEFITFFDDTLAVSVKFSQYSIFVANENAKDYTGFVNLYLSSFKPDFVFVKEGYTVPQSYIEKTYSYKASDNAKYNSSLGNFKIFGFDKTTKIRSID